MRIPVRHLGFVLAMLPLTTFADEGKPPYLLSVSFYGPSLSQWTAETAANLEATPYDGAAATVRSGYDTGPAPTPAEFEAALKAVADA
ncbi:MAG: hypothetical protein FJ272_06560, partial [Planctomycetes bacterium]|nr:hypothetical protein [Planctomycetota bacterium]